MPLDAAIEKLRAQVEANVGVGASAIAYIKGVPALIQTAVDEAKAAGATPEQLAALNSLHDSLEAETQAFVDALNANPAQPTPSTPDPNAPSSRPRR